MTRPGRLRYIADGVGRPLPESIGDRIRNDLTGSAATPGHLIRSMLAFLPMYAGVALLLPGSPAFRAAALAWPWSWRSLTHSHAAPVDTNTSGNSTDAAIASGDDIGR